MQFLWNTNFHPTNTSGYLTSGFKYLSFLVRKFAEIIENLNISSQGITAQSRILFEIQMFFHRNVLRMDFLWGTNFHALIPCGQGIYPHGFPVGNNFLWRDSLWGRNFSVHGFPVRNEFLRRDSIQAMNLSVRIPCGEQSSSMDSLWGEQSSNMDSLWGTKFKHGFPVGNKLLCMDPLWGTNLSAGIPCGQ